MTVAVRPLSPTRAIRVLRDSVAHALIDQERTRSMEMGTLIDGLLFGRPPKVARIPFDDYRSKAAREARDAAIADGAIPLKNGEEDEITVAVEQLAPKVARLGIVERHVKMEWLQSGCPHRGEMDGIAPSAGGLLVYDLKTCEAGKSRAVSTPQSIYAMGYDVQGMAYVEGLASTRQLDPESIGFALVFVETGPPFSMVVRRFSPAMRVLGSRRWERARAMWLNAYRTGDFSPDLDTEVGPTEWAIRDEEALAFDANQERGVPF